MVIAITASALSELMASQVVDVIDVRDRNEWESGYIAGSRLVPLDQLRADPEAVLVPGTVIVFVCARGVRSMQAAKLAERFGHDRVYSLEGGTKEWTQVGRSLVTESRVAA